MTVRRPCPPRHLDRRTRDVGDARLRIRAGLGLGRVIRIEPAPSEPREGGGGVVRVEALFAERDSELQVLENVALAQQRSASSPVGANQRPRPAAVVRSFGRNGPRHGRSATRPGSGRLGRSDRARRGAVAGRRDGGGPLIGLGTGPRRRSPSPGCSIFARRGSAGRADARLVGHPLAEHAHAPSPSSSGRPRPSARCR
jgi:hypothetical protein